MLSSNTDRAIPIATHNRLCGHPDRVDGWPQGVSAGDCTVSRLKPMDARQQPILASTTNVLEAVLLAEAPSSQSEELCPFCIDCCSSSPNRAPPSILYETIVSTMHHHCCVPPKTRSAPPHTTVKWLSMDSLQNLSCTADNGHR